MGGVAAKQRVISPSLMMSEIRDVGSLQSGKNNHKHKNALNNLNNLKNHSKSNSKNHSISISKAQKSTSIRSLNTSFSSRYDVTDVLLGTGASSEVKLCIDRSTNAKVAVKIVSRRNMLSDDLLALRREAKILKGLVHENIVGFIDYIEEDNFIYLIMEYLEGGQLFDRIVKKSVYTEKEARDVIRSIVSAVKYCHDNFVVHRDLKPENLIFTKQSDSSQLKIADFGFAVKAKGNVLTTECGTPGYIAPEILEEKRYGKAVDMWSIGVITYIMLGGYPPFYDENRRNLYRKIKKGDYKFHSNSWSAVSDEAKDLIKKLLCVNENNRLTADQVLAHPWLNAQDTKLLTHQLSDSLVIMRDYHSPKNIEDKESNQTVGKFRAAANMMVAATHWQKLLRADTDSVQSLEDDANGKSGNKINAIHPVLVLEELT